jgi:DNA-binding ferritin-like protein
MKQLINSLQELQSNSFIYSNLVKGFYLNTESVLMRQSQIVYKEIYLESDRLLMETSLWLRRLGGEALYTIEDISASQTLGNVKPDTYCGVEMATHLVPINKTMIEEIRVVTDQAIASKEWALVPHLSELLKKHQEWNWMLESSLKLPPNPWKSLKD